MPTVYPIRAVSKITGLSLDTLRAWERRYQAVVPERSDRGRQYNSHQIDRLLLLSQLVQADHAIGSIAGLSDQELRDLLIRRPIPPAVYLSEGADVLAVVLTAVDNFDAALTRDELSRLAAVIAPRDLVYRVVIPLMNEVGKRWHQGVMAVSQEHLVTHILRSLLESMIRVLRPGKIPVKMIFATPEGESHDLGTLAAAMLATIAGIEPIYLGANLPAEEIAFAARRTSARVVALGITIPSTTTMKEIRTIAAEMPGTTELWIGGASGAKLNTSDIPNTPRLMRDLTEFETACHLWRN
jgi:MerR family transcriptional regulator, light-induced transcriptional regulator